MLKGKKGIIFGIANDHSIAWGIAKKFKEQGASLAIVYQNETLLKRVAPLAKELNAELMIKCDFSINNELETCFQEISKKWESIDFIVHAVAFSNKNELNGKYINTSKENFINTLHISCFSLTKIALLSSTLMANGGSIITLSFYGANKVMPSYNVMGIAKAALEISVKYLSVDLGDKKIRVNAISSGPMRTLSGAVIGKSREVYKYTQENSPLKRNVKLEEIGKTALFLASDMSSGITGEIHFVDCGFNIVGMPNN